MRLRPYKRRCLSLVLLGGFFLSGSWAFAQKKWTIDDILHAERMVSVQISPDGRLVFFQTGFTADGYYPVKPSKFYTVDANGKNIVELAISSPATSPDPHSRLLRWTPDSRQISYLASTDGTRKQVWTIAATGGDAIQRTQADNQVSDFEWSPDGTKLLYVTDVPASKEELDYREKWGVVISPEEKQWARRKIVWIKDMQTDAVSQLTDTIALSGTPKWSHDGHDVAFVSMDSLQTFQLFVVSVNEPRRAKRVSGLGENVRFFAWSPKEKAMAYITAERQYADYANYHEGTPLQAGNIWLCDIGGNARKITDSPYPQLTNLIWSHDGEKLVFISQAPETASLKEYNRYIPLYMHVLSISDGSTKKLAEGMDFFRGGEDLAWSADDRMIWFVNGEGVGYNLFAVEVATGKARHVTTGKDCVNLATFDDAFSKVAFLRQNVNMKPDVYVSDIVRWNPKRITDVNPWVKDYANEQGEVVSYPSDGWNIEALLIKPPGFNPKKKYPLIVVVHGGPNWHKLNEWQPDWEQYPLKAYAAEGYVLFFPNFRGSANYGVDFIKTTHHDLGGMDFMDVMRGVDYLVSQGYVDENRMGVCGWSYGGFLTPTIITRTNRFKAAQFGAGLPSIEGMYASLWTVERILQKSFDSYPWEDGAMRIQYSPLYHADKVKTPTLIQHGDKDPRCPVGGAVLFYKALKSYGVPTVLEIYPGMGHSITDPLLYKRILAKNLEWFNKWLKNDTSTSFEHVFSRQPEDVGKARE